MLDLIHSLQGRDLGHLRIIAELWGLELNAPDARSGLQQLAPAMLDSRQLDELVEVLPEEAHTALDDLIHNDGKLPWALFIRRYGALREMGPGRRDREQPHRNPASPVEMLWYRGLVGRAFLDTAHGPQEYAFIPSDLLPLLPAPASQKHASPGRAATPGERAFLMPASDRILDHACTLLAALRLGLPGEEIEAVAGNWHRELGRAAAPRLTPASLQALLSAADLLDDNLLPRAEAARHFLEMPRGKALAQLARAWMHSPLFNDLRFVPDLSIEGEWKNDPLQARYAVLDVLAVVPRDTWWNLESFVRAIHETQPDFQRPAGDYDSWYIRSIESGEFLRGYENWDSVDGALIRFLITGPLHWLGFIDLAAPGSEAAPGAFRYSSWAEDLLSGAPPEGLEVEDVALLVSSDARLRAPKSVPRAARYQIARFSAWEGELDGTYLYRITPASLERARQQGLRVIHLLTLLERYALTVPPSLVKALERWQEQGSEARLEQATILRLRSPEMLHLLRTSRAARFLGDPLGPTVVIVKPGARDKVLAILAEMGYLGESIIE